MKRKLMWMLLPPLLTLTACDGSLATKPVPSGLVVTDLVTGSGAVAGNGDMLTVLYEGRFTDGTVFDSSLRRTFMFQLGTGQVIRGLDMGMPGARVGGTRRLVIPPYLGYGEAGHPPQIPPNATLIFDVQLIEVRSP